MPVAAPPRAAPAQQTRLELADIFSRHADLYCASHYVTPSERKAFRKSPPLSMPLLAQAGLHPLLRLHVGLATSDKILSDMSIRR